MNQSVLRLIAGFRKFKNKYFDPANSTGDENGTLYSRLSSVGQNPKTLLIGCSDSRVDPAILTEASPGELFVVRNVANLVPPCEPSSVGFHGTSSAIEFSVVNLKVENIIILGHRQCGGIRALIQKGREQSHSFVGQWMAIAEEARVKVVSENPSADEDQLWRLAEMESIKVSMKNLLTFPFVKDAVEAGHLKIFGAYFDLEQGQLYNYDHQKKEFLQVDL